MSQNMKNYQKILPGLSTIWFINMLIQKYLNISFSLFILQPLKILVLSRPKSGRSVYCQYLCDKLKLELINLERPLKEIMKKIKKNAADPKMDDND